MPAAVKRCCQTLPVDDVRCRGRASENVQLKARLFVMNDSTRFFLFPLVPRGLGRANFLTGGGHYRFWNLTEGAGVLVTQLIGGKYIYSRIWRKTVF